MDRSPVQAIPSLVAWLAYGGLLPFLALTPALIIDAPHALFWADALLAYGAVILSFVGAVHWGLAMSLSDADADRRNALLVWSVVPALLAWLAYLLAPALASVLLVVGFLAHYWQDHRLIDRARLPAWYLPLRLRLTTVVCACLAVSGFFHVG